MKKPLSSVILTNFSTLTLFSGHVSESVVGSVHGDDAIVLASLEQQRHVLEFSLRIQRLVDVRKRQVQALLLVSFASHTQGCVCKDEVGGPSVVEVHSVFFRENKSKVTVRSLDVRDYPVGEHPGQRRPDDDLKRSPELIQEPMKVISFPEVHELLGAFLVCIAELDSLSREYPALL